MQGARIAFLRLPGRPLGLANRRLELEVSRYPGTGYGVDMTRRKSLATRGKVQCQRIGRRPAHPQKDVLGTEMARRPLGDVFGRHPVQTIFLLRGETRLSGAPPWRRIFVISAESRTKPGRCTRRSGATLPCRRSSRIPCNRTLTKRAMLLERRSTTWPPKVHRRRAGSLRRRD